MHALHRTLSFVRLNVTETISAAAFSVKIVASNSTTTAYSKIMKKDTKEYWLPNISSSFDET